MMVTKDIVLKIAESQLDNNELFVVDVKISTASDIELSIDSDTRVAIDQCAKLSRAVEAELDAQGFEDYSLLVCSAGIGYPLKVERQLKKCIGKIVEVVKNNGQKVAGELLEGATMQSVELKYSVKEAVEGKKRKELVEKIEKIDLCDAKSICEVLTIK